MARRALRIKFNHGWLLSLAQRVSGRPHNFLATDFGQLGERSSRMPVDMRLF